MSHDHHDHDHHDHDHDHDHDHPLDIQEFTLEGIQKRWADNSRAGKLGMVLGSTVSVGVLVHGMMNIKRGIVGYDDTLTGEHKKGSVENLLFGVGESYVGSAMLRRFLTGNPSMALWK